MSNGIMGALSANPASDTPTERVPPSSQQLNVGSVFRWTLEVHSDSICSAVSSLGEFACGRDGNARQDQPPVSPTQKLAESILSGQPVISGEDIGFRITSVRNRGTAVGELTVGQLMVRVNGVWREATLESTPRVIPVR